jgi:hypothetical protein
MIDFLQSYGEKAYAVEAVMFRDRSTIEFSVIAHDRIEAEQKGRRTMTNMGYRGGYKLFARLDN